MTAFVIYSWTPLFSRPPPLRFPTSVLLFRVEFVHGLLRPCVGFDWERRPYPPRALWAFESIQSPGFYALCNGFSISCLAQLIEGGYEFFAVIPVHLDLS